MQLQLSTWQEVEDYLAGNKTIIIPIGSTEQHGPTGMIGTDAICPEVLARAVGEETGGLVAPTLPLGMAQHHMAFPGTVTLRPSTLMALLLDTVNSLVRHGFERFYFLNGHGGNMATLSASFSEVYTQATASSGKLQCRQRNWWDGEKTRQLSRQLFGAAEGRHATCSEISLTYYLYPDYVKSAELDPKTAPAGPIFDAEDFRRRHPDGRMGSNPALANADAGEQLFVAAVADIATDYRDFAG